MYLEQVRHVSYIISLLSHVSYIISLLSHVSYIMSLLSHVSYICLTFVCVYLEQASTNSRAFDKTSETEQDTGAEMKRREVTSTGKPQRRQLPTLMDLVITTPHRMRV